MHHKLFVLKFEVAFLGLVSYYSLFIGKDIYCKNCLLECKMSWFLYYEKLKFPNLDKNCLSTFHFLTEEKRKEKVSVKNSLFLEMFLTGVF